MGMEEPHANIGESTGSLSASASLLSLLLWVFFVSFVSPATSPLIQSFFFVEEHEEPNSKKHVSLEGMGSFYSWSWSFFCDWNVLIILTVWSTLNRNTFPSLFCRSVPPTPIHWQASRGEARLSWTYNDAAWVAPVKGLRRSVSNPSRYVSPWHL